MMRTRILLFLLSLILVPTATIAVIMFARGYRFNLTLKTLHPTGLLSVTSLPTGASVFVDDKLVTASDTTINLVPSTYRVKFKKDGYFSWEKTLRIDPEVVTRTGPLLFPSVPALKAVTAVGASLPALSEDGSRIAYVSENKLYTLDLSESPLGLLNRESKLVTNLQDLRSKIYNLSWSPDNKQILLLSTPSAYLVDLVKAETQPVLDLQSLRDEWNITKASRLSQNIELLPQIMQQVLATAAADLVWSPHENKLMYTATASAIIPDKLIHELPGSSTQTESRSLKPGDKYVYDLEEDRNFGIQCSVSGIQWFSDSNHLICAQNKRIVILDYDNTNHIEVYNGPMEGNFVAPYPSSKQMLILTNLTDKPLTQPNLYAVSLR